MCSNVTTHDNTRYHGNTLKYTYTRYLVYQVTTIVTTRYHGNTGTLYALLHYTVYILQVTLYSLYILQVTTETTRYHQILILILILKLLLIWNK